MYGDRTQNNDPEIQDTVHDTSFPSMPHHL